MTEREREGETERERERERERETEHCSWCRPLGPKTDQVVPGWLRAFAQEKKNSIAIMPKQVLMPLHETPIWFTIRVSSCNLSSARMVRASEWAGGDTRSVKNCWWS